MSTLYTIYLVNNSNHFENFNIFQQSPPIYGNANAINLASFAHAGEPGATVAFDWSEPDGPNDDQPAKCWVAAGNFGPGEVLDPDQMIAPVEVAFPPGCCGMQVTLNPDNTWTVAPAAE
jgi:hypothetical protein